MRNLKEKIEAIEAKAHEYTTDLFMEFASNKMHEWQKRNPRRKVEIRTGMGDMSIFIDDERLEWSNDWEVSLRNGSRDSVALMHGKRLGFKELEEIYQMTEHLNCNHMDDYPRDLTLEPIR